MPLVAHNDLPTFQRLKTGGELILSLERATHQDIRELHIGFLNMMPDSALQATERQFIRAMRDILPTPQRVSRNATVATLESLLENNGFRLLDLEGRTLRKARAGLRCDLSAIAKGETESPLIDKLAAVKLLGNMHGGYNIETLIGLLDDAELGEQAASELKHTLLMFEAFHDVAELELALTLNPRLIGINNRNLQTFDTDIGIAVRMAEKLAPGQVPVAASGCRPPRPKARSAPRTSPGPSRSASSETTTSAAATTTSRWVPVGEVTNTARTASSARTWP